MRLILPFSFKSRTSIVPDTDVLANEIDNVNNGMSDIVSATAPSNGHIGNSVALPADTATEPAETTKTKETEATDTAAGTTTAKPQEGPKPLTTYTVTYIINGYDDATLRPRRNTTRAEICRMFYSIESYFNYDGPMYRDGVFAAICDHIIENSDDLDWYITTENAAICIRCSDTRSYIYIYCVKENDNGIEEIYFNINALTDHYDYTYQQRIYTGENESISPLLCKQTLPL